MGTKDAEPLAAGVCLAEGVARREVGVCARDEIGAGSELRERGVNVGIVNFRQRQMGGVARPKFSEAFLGAAAVSLQMQRYQGVDRRSPLGVQVAHAAEMVGQRHRLGQGPGLEGCD